MEVLKIFDPKFHEIIKDEVKSVLLDNPEVSKELPTQPRENEPQLPSPEKPKSLSCNYCKIEFDDVQQQRDHYKLDWHRYNLKKSLQSKDSINESEFNDKSLTDDLSSISGSDTETDNEKDDNLDSFASAQGKIFLRNSLGQVFSMYNCLVRDKRDYEDQIILERLKERCVTNQTWTVLMLGGGHFAGAVFKKDKAILHKTFHCYTVRAGQGGSQSSKDNQKGGVKSAGSSLRRYNEQSLVQHVRGILGVWKNDLSESSLIIYRAAGPYNRSVLFGGNDGAALLNKNDPRLVTIPFSTRRATLKEVERVHGTLSSIILYRDFQSAKDHFTREKQPEIGSKRGKVRINRAKSREIVERPLPVSPSSDSDSDDYQLITNNSEIDLNESLQEFDDSLTSEERKPRKKSKKKPRKSLAKKAKELEERRKADILETIATGNLEKLKSVMENAEKIEVNVFVDEILDLEGNSLLHTACLNEQNEIVKFLLENNANPCLRNEKQQTPYSCTRAKEIRDTLKDFARDNPTKFNYNKASIPLDALNAEESAEKRRLQRHIKKEKEKIKKHQEKLKKLENEEKLRFLNLSDREKRALAAERRLLTQSGSITSRCFLCGADISGKVPFEYSTNRFCSVDCLKSHRIQNTTIL